MLNKTWAFALALARAAAPISSLLAAGEPLTARMRPPERRLQMPVHRRRGGTPPGRSLLRPTRATPRHQDWLGPAGTTREPVNNK